MRTAASPAGTVALHPFAAHESGTNPPLQALFL
jgi:hypothetical protein